MKIERQTSIEPRPKGKGIVLFSLTFCVMGIGHFYKFFMWGFALLFVVSGIAAFLRLKPGRLLILLAACYGFIVFCIDEISIFRFARADFFSKMNILEILVATAFYLGAVYFFTRPKIKEQYSSS